MIDILIIFILLLFHGVFALIEMAFVSSKRVRLLGKFNAGNKSAGVALHLLDEPEDLLSTIQFGITVLEIIAGVFGGASFAGKLIPLFSSIPVISQYAAELSFILVVSFITYLSVIIGDLVPKSVGLTNPERYAVFFAPFMVVTKKVFLPVVTLFSYSTKVILNMLLIRGKDEPPVTARELKLLIHEAYQHGVLQSRESELLQSILQFNSVKAETMMKPADQIVWINYADSNQKIHETILKNSFNRFPVFENSIGNVIGIISGKEFITNYYTDPNFKLEEILYDPLIIPPDIDALRLLEKFRVLRCYLAIIADENGTTLGIITLQNLVETIVGKLPDFYETEEDRFYRRDDGTVLIDAGIMLEEAQAFLSTNVVIEENVTLGSYFHQMMDRIPKVGDKVNFDGFQFEIVDMDGVKVDKILAKKVAGHAADEADIIASVEE